MLANFGDLAHLERFDINFKPSPSRILNAVQRRRPESDHLTPENAESEEKRNGHRPSAESVSMKHSLHTCRSRTHGYITRQPWHAKKPIRPGARHARRSFSGWVGEGRERAAGTLVVGQCPTRINGRMTVVFKVSESCHMATGAKVGAAPGTREEDLYGYAI